MKRLFLIWIAISVALFLILGYFVDIRAYTENVSENMPNWRELLNDVSSILSRISTNQYDIGQVIDWDSFWQAVGQFFSGTFQYLKAFFQLLVYVPTKVLVFLIKTIVAFMPIGIEGGAVVL